MTDIKMEDSYEGDLPYLFVSYSHKDQNEMDSVKRLLDDHKIRYWYDGGLNSGDDWNLKIATRLKNATVCLLLLSSNSADSEYVKNELNFANSHRIPIHILLLHRFELPIDIEMMTGRFQMVEMTDDYHKEFIKSLPNEVFVDFDCAINNEVYKEHSFFTTSSPVKPQSTHKRKHSIRMFATGIIVLFILILPTIVIFVLKQPFGLLWRIVYFVLLLILAKVFLYEVNTRPTMASACFGTLTEDDLKETPNVVFSRVMGAFGKDVFVSKEETKQFTCLYKLKRLTFGTWDNKRTNYLKILFRRKLEWYDPSVFYLHVSSKAGEAIKMLTRQGFILQPLPTFINIKGDYLIKDDFHVFLYYKKRKLDYAVIYQCDDTELWKKYQMIEEIENNEEIVE